MHEQAHKHERLLLLLFRVSAACYALVIVLLSLIPSEPRPGRFGYVAVEVLFQTWTGLAAGLAATSTAPTLVAVLFLMRRSTGQSRALPSGIRLLLASTAALASTALIVAAAVNPLAVLRLVGNSSVDHALAYSSLGLLMSLGWGTCLGLVPLGTIALLASVALETLQVVLPGRSASGWDLLANFCGLAVGLGLGSAIMDRRPARSSNGRRERRSPSMKEPLL